MSTRVKQFLGALAQPLPLTTGRELVPVALPETPQSLAADIRRLNTEVENALLTAVANGIEAGKALVAAKRLVGHGNFEPYVTIECYISMSTAQNYMRLAKHEDIIRPLLSANTQGVGYLKMKEALRLIDKLHAKKKLKKPNSKTA
jgi:hypothetical protein